MSNTPERIPPYPAPAESSYIPPEVRVVGRVGDIARGTLGEHIGREQAEATLRQTVDYRVPVAPDAPSTCMDDGEAGGNLSGSAVELRTKQAGGDAMGNWLGGELTRAARGEHSLNSIRAIYADPIDRMRAGRWLDIQTDTVPRAGAHVRLGGHGACGCGMADHLPKVGQTIIEEADRAGNDRLAELAARFTRHAFNGSIHRGLVTDSRRLAADFERFGWDGARFIEGVRHPEPDISANDGSILLDDDIEVTTGDHAPDLLVIHYGDGTLNRDRYVAETGKKVLWIDEPAIWRTAQATALNPGSMWEITARYQAIMTANVAGAVTLGGPQLHVGVVGRPQPVAPAGR